MVSLQHVISCAGFTDETPRDYHCNLGPDGRRRDADDRPELCRGTVEFVASKEYMVGWLIISAILEVWLCYDGFF